MVHKIKQGVNGYMADEQIIYLSPEEELTNVRERLEKIPSRRIILVVPGQTQLRSHVSWRLLHTRARELNKELLIISSDRQIRSVVKAAGFRVADSLESQPSGRSRMSSRSGRASLGGKTSARLRTPPGKGASSPSTGGLRNRQDAQSAPSLPPMQPIEPPANHPALGPKIEDLSSHKDDVPLGRMSSSAPSTFEIEDVQDETYEPPFNYGMSAPAPPVRPINSMTPLYEEEEPNLWEEDIQRARRIREAAQGDVQSDGDTMLPPVQQEAAPQDRPQIQDLPSTPAPRQASPSFSYMANDPVVHLPEQHAALPMDEVDDGVADIADYPTDVINIEDQGDMGDIVRRSEPSQRPWTDEVEEDGQDIPGPSRIHGMRPRASRSGRVMPEPAQDEETSLPPVYNQPTRTFPQRPSGNLSPAASAGPLGSAGNREPQPVALPSRMQANAKPKPTTPLKKKKPDVRTAAIAAGTGAAAVGVGRASRQGTTTQGSSKAKSKRGGGKWIGPVLVVLVVLILVLLTLLVPSADVTVTLLSQNYSLPMKLTATRTSRQDVLHQTLPAQMLSFDSSVTGSGTATGSTSVGNASATGNIVFTYNGTGQVVIPTGTTVATKSGIEFVTQAEVLAGGPPTPVQATTAGTQGNVAANTITVIPAGSLTKIQQDNPGVSVSAITLMVTNPNATNGGGAGKATAVTNNDVNKVKSTLAIQLQTQVKNYLSKNVHTGDEPGQPIMVETPVATPAVGAVATGGTFAETLKLHMTVLVVRAPNLQTAASAQIQASLDKQKANNLALVPEQSVVVQQLKNLSPNNGQSVILSFTAIGQVASRISEDIIRNQVTGKSIENATLAISPNGGVQGLENPQITVSPGFFHWMPFLSQRITVHFKTRLVQPAPKPKPKKR